MSGLAARWSSLLAYVVGGIRRRPAPLLAAAAVLTLVVGALTYANMRINTSVIDLMDPDLPFMKNVLEFSRAFPQEADTIVIVVDAGTPERAAEAAGKLVDALKPHTAEIKSIFYPAGDPFFQRHGLLYSSIGEIEALSAELARAQPLLASLNADPSLRGLADVLTLSLSHLDEMGNDGKVPPVFDHTLGEMAATVRDAAAGKARAFSWEDLFAGGMESAHGDRRRQIIVVEPVLDFSALKAAGPAEALIRTTAAQLQLTPEHGVRVRLTGELLMLQDELVSVEESSGVANIVTLVVVIGLLVLGLKSFRLVLGTLAALVVGLTLTSGLGLLVFGQFNMISVAFAVLFIGISVDFGIQYSLRYQELVNRGLPVGLALEEAAAAIGPALTLAAASAAIGFFAFLPTSYRGLAELGAIAGMGMVVALITNLTILPAVIALLPTEARDPSRETLGLQRPLQHLIEHHPRWVVGLALLIALISATQLPRVRFDDSALNLRDPSAESVATTMELLQDPMVDPYRATVLVANQAEAERIAQKLRALPEVREVVTLSDLVPADQAEKLRLIEDMALFMGPILTPPPPRPAPSAAEDKAALARLAEVARSAGSPGSLALAEAIGRLPGGADLSALQQALLGDFPQTMHRLALLMEAGPVTLDSLPKELRARQQAADGRVLVEVFPKADARIQENRQAFAAAVQSVAPDASGEAIIATEGGQAVLHAFLEAGIIAAVLIFALVLWMLRDLADTLMVMAPLALASLLTIAISVEVGISLNFANVVVWPLLLGLGVASGIYMVLRDRQEPSAHLLETSTPRAVFFSALTTIASFGSLAIVKHPGLASMGRLLTLAISLSLISTVVVLPALRVVFVASRRGAAADVEEGVTTPNPRKR
ncbi:MAG: MMPL family transporter [Rhodospirillales bacterium]